MPRKKSAPPVIAAPLDAPAAGLHPDRFIEEKLIAARAGVERCVADAAAFAQLHPEKALLWALASGYMLRMLPTVRILSGLLRVALVVAKPAAFVYGVAKLWQKSQAGATPHSTQEVS